MPEQTNAAPEGYTTVAPWVVTDDTGAFLDFVTQAFRGEERGRVSTEDGLIGHGEIRIGDTVVLAFDRHADWPHIPSLLRVFIADADQAFSRAVAAAAMSSPSGERRLRTARGRVKDPFGNIWWVVSSVEDVSEDEMWRRLQDPVYAEVMRTAQETLDAELSGRRVGLSSAPVKTTS
ncbi:VOC family protein [Streptosporangium lutulentum]